MGDYAGPYLRTQGGLTVHKPDCRSVNRKNVHPIPWSWADGKIPTQISEHLAGMGLSYNWCRYCFGGMRGGA